MVRMIVFALSLSTAITLGQIDKVNKPVFIPKGGFVPDAETAVKIAEAVLVPVYGQKQVESERPFKATVKGDSWTVQGTLQCAPNCVGGTALVEISKSTGQILQMFHTK
jgi:hypothetical protein